MLEKKFIEKLLTANGVDPSSPDEDIKSVLISAKWHKDDVDTAIMVLRENTATHEQRVDSVKHVFTTDERLKPETISSLLGINVDIPPPGESSYNKGDMGISNVVGIIAISLIFSVTFVLSAMWYMQMGPFYIAY